MRWIYKPPPNPEFQWHKKFAWKPTIIRDNRDIAMWVWLEFYWTRKQWVSHISQRSGIGDRRCDDLEVIVLPSKCDNRDIDF